MTDQSIRQRIGARFDNAAATYDAHSAPQRHAAARLADRIAVCGLPPRPRVLEIGCGTGHLTEKLLQVLPGATILATDIAPAMVAVCRARFAVHPALSCAVMDACHPAGLDGRYDLICGNLVAQWFPDLPDALARLSGLLAPGGVLALSLLGPDTFREWRAAHAAQGVCPGTPAFPSLEACRAAFPGSGRLDIASEHWTDRPGDGLAFLRGLRAIGADTPAAGHVPLPPARLRAILRGLGAAPAITYAFVYACWQPPA